ncbi:MAG: AAC(3) family N-acetyltransferase [Candidatus Riflebacteria bacterium]|nr:AAC(3) family N-acetyltransferase [Candidatus Riflebacteria bacterium]
MDEIFRSIKRTGGAFALQLVPDLVKFILKFKNRIIQPYVRKRYSMQREKALKKYGQFGKTELHELFRNIGLNNASTLFVMSSWDSMHTFSGNPYDVIDVLLNVIGSKSTLCMTAFPPLKISKNFEVFDVRHDPSKTGLITEYFRRIDGVIRSRQLRSVCAFGPEARFLTESHHLSPFTCGVKSPYWLLREIDSYFLLLGLFPSTYVLNLHCVEDVLCDDFPICVYPPEPNQITVIDYDGRPLNVKAYRLLSHMDFKMKSVAPIMSQYFEDLFLIKGIYKGIPYSLVKIKPWTDRVIQLARKDIHAFGNKFPEPEETIKLITQ